MHCCFVFNGAHPSFLPPNFFRQACLPTTDRPTYLLTTDHDMMTTGWLPFLTGCGQLLAAERTNGLLLVGANDFY